MSDEPPYPSPERAIWIANAWMANPETRRMFALFGRLGRKAPIYGSRLPRLRMAFWSIVRFFNRKGIYVVYVDGSIDSVFRSAKQAFEYANLEGGEVNDDTPLYGRLTGRDAIVGAELRAKSGWR